MKQYNWIILRKLPQEAQDSYKITKRSIINYLNKELAKLNDSAVLEEGQSGI